MPVLLQAGRVVLLCVAAGCRCDSQVAQKPNEDYDTAERRQRAALEMDHWVRAGVERTGDLVASLGLRPGDVVADIGTGVGYLLPYLAARVGPQGAVIAEDIFPDFLAKAQEKIDAAGWRNVRTVLGSERDPKLPANQLDVALLLDTYHHLNYPTETLRHIRRALKVRGQLIIVEYYRSRKHPSASDEDLRSHIRLDRDEVVAEVSAHGFRLAKQYDHLPHEYVLMFGRTK
jgi:ubiquinone/menaquinone biosynthesis C-methylase UbiE